MSRRNSSTSRFELASDEARAFVVKVRNDVFDGLAGARIMVLFDKERRTKAGQIVVSDLKLANDLVAFLSKNLGPDPTGYDYVEIIDKNLWERMDDDLRFRIIRHDLRHCLVDPDAKKPCRRIPHDIEDFATEMRLNEDDPNWQNRLASVVAETYDEKGDPNPLPDKNQGSLLPGQE